MKMMLKTALLAAAVMTSSAYAACSTDVFVSADDLYSSKGVKLQSVGQIVRQAVANAGVSDCGLGEASNRTNLQKAIDATRQDRNVSNMIKEGDVRININWNGKRAQLSIFAQG